MMAFADFPRAREDEPLDPNHEMWVFRYTRDGNPWEIHARRHETIDPYVIAKQLANTHRCQVTYTAAYITAHYNWQWRNGDSLIADPLWMVVDAPGARRHRRIEHCPNGCGDCREDRS